MKKIFICGYYGFDNLGDEAILKALVEGIRRKASDVEITVLSASRHKTEEEYGVQAISRNDYRALMHAMKTQDLILFGGGSLLQDVTSSRSILYYLGLMFLGKLHRKPVYMVAQGIGPIRRRPFRMITRSMFHAARYISVRDRISLKELESMGISKERTVLTTDPVWALPVEERQLRSDGDKPEVLLSLRPWGDPAAMESKWIKLVNALQSEMQAEVGLLSFHLGQDAPLARQIAEKTGCSLIPYTADASVVLNRIKSADLLIGVRLHSLIFSALVGTPMIGISYDPKVDAFVEAMEAGPVYKVEDFSVPEVVEMAKLRLADETFYEKLQVKRLDLRDQAKRDQKEMIQELLNE